MEGAVAASALMMAVLIVSNQAVTRSQLNLDQSDHWAVMEGRSSGSAAVPRAGGGTAGIVAGTSSKDAYDAFQAALSFVMEPSYAARREVRYC